VPANNECDVKKLLFDQGIAFAESDVSRVLYNMSAAVYIIASGDRVNAPSSSYVYVCDRYDIAIDRLGRVRRDDRTQQRSEVMRQQSWPRHTLAAALQDKASRCFPRSLAAGVKAAA
jgi:hypothetical protein